MGSQALPFTGRCGSSQCFSASNAQHGPLTVAQVQASPPATTSQRGPESTPPWSVSITLHRHFSPLFPIWPSRSLAPSRKQGGQDIASSSILRKITQSFSSLHPVVVVLNQGHRVYLTEIPQSQSSAGWEKASLHPLILHTFRLQSPTSPSYQPLKAKQNIFFKTKGIYMLLTKLFITNGW